MILWNTLLELKRMIDKEDSLPNKISINLISKRGIEINSQKKLNEGLVIHLNGSCSDPFGQDFFHMELANEVELLEKDLELFHLYFPYTCLNFFGAKRKKSYAISHFAQTLDGRIASCAGDSKWIGNDENLVHAHRMRALCDAILVGSKTVEIDNPRLNVRKVVGHDPIKVVVGGNGQLNNGNFHAITPETIVFKNQSYEGECFDCIVIPKSPHYDPNKVLEILASKGIYSVYIEGGSFTTSSFLKSKALDQVQLHFSNKILGSGTNSFLVDGISTVKESITFKDCQYYKMGSEMMFVGTTN